MTQIKTGAAALAAIAVLASCSNEDPAGNDSGADEQTTTSSTPTAGYKIVPDESGAIGAGPWAVRAEGLPDAPLAVFDVPDGFFGGGSHIWTNKGRIGYFNPGGVYEDPCSDSGVAPSAGDTVEDLAAALRAQKLTITARPVPVSVDGHNGLYLEMTAPADFDVEKCRDGVLTVWEDGPLFFGEPLVERLWILDVDGQRVVLDYAFVTAEATDETARLFTGIARNATFVEG
jgi:hypothetical protein